MNSMKALEKKVVARAVQKLSTTSIPAIINNQLKNFVNRINSTVSSMTSSNLVIQKQLKALNHQVKNIHANNKHMKEMTESRLDELTKNLSICDTALLEVKTKPGAIGCLCSSQQLQINLLKKKMSKHDSVNADVKRIETEIFALKTAVDNTSDLETIKSDINALNHKLIKVDDIEQFQSFVSDKYDSMAVTVSNHSKFVTDVESSLRNELRGGLAKLEKKFVAEEGRFNEIRKAFLKDVEKIEHTEKSLTEFKQKIDTSNKHNQNQLNNIMQRQEIDEQYSRRNCIEIHGIPESPRESTNQIALNLFKTMNVNVNTSHISRSHRLKRNPNHTRNLPRPIIVKFVNYDVREQVYVNRNVLRTLPNCKRVFINENLTFYRKGLYREIRKLHGFGWSTWTNEGNIFICRGVPTSTSKTVRVTNYAEYYKFVEDIGKSDNPLI